MDLRRAARYSNTGQIISVTAVTANTAITGFADIKICQIVADIPTNVTLNEGSGPSRQLIVTDTPIYVVFNGLVDDVDILSADATSTGKISFIAVDG
jgi:hypothetical protein